MEIKLQVPTSLADITLREYKKYERIIKTNSEDENSERFVNLKMLEIFCGIKYEQAAGMSLVDYERIVVQLYDILNQTPKLVRRFYLGKREFGFIPNLEEMTFGEYVDLDTYIHDMSQIEKAMSVLYRPITNKHKDKYTIQKYEGDLLHETLLDMPMDAVVSSILFFYNLGIDLSNAMMSCLQEEEVQQLQKQVSQISGVGINPYTDWQRGILEDLRK